MLELYHYGTAVCPQRARLVLTEKGLQWTSHILNIRMGEHLNPQYLKLNPKGVVPTLVHDSNVFVETTVIMYYLDEAFPELPLQPADPVGRARTRMWTKRVDDELHPDCGVLSWTTYIRTEMLARPPEDLEEHYRKMPDPDWRDLQRQCFEMGIEAPVFRSAIRRYDKVLGIMEEALADGPWLGGADYTLADAAVTPYVLRLDMLGMSGMWEGSRPRVGDWYGRVRARPSAAVALDAYIKPADADKMIGPGTEVWPEIQKILAA
ncbi:MAG: glutathione S-transferase family protein [Rhodospirillales bacterium]|jgi:glutathione S-transferase|nr:glutathione S-transferase family protein [Rhodospirillales bacterium]HJO72806.1 glutathione S-transferase family protein [Rhodospirillales bacterium]